MNNVENIKKRAGRPKKENPFTSTITAKITESDRKKFSVIEKTLQIGISDLIRFALEKEYDSDSCFSELRQNLKELNIKVV